MESIRVNQVAQHRDSEADAWDSLGYAYHGLGRHNQAVTSYQYALTLFQEFGDRYNEAATLDRLGDTHRAASNATAARNSWLASWQILHDLGYPDADDVQTKVRLLDGGT
jgi:Flp pilus assembly protein TadD